MRNYDDLRKDFGWGECMKCPSFGRTGASKNFRDSSHSYCRQCRAEAQRNRYQGNSIKARTLQEIEEAMNALRGETPNVPMALVCLGRAASLVNGRNPDVVVEDVVPPTMKPPYEGLHAQFTKAWREDNFAEAWKACDLMAHYYPDRAEVDTFKRLVKYPPDRVPYLPR